MHMRICWSNINVDTSISLKLLNYLYLLSKMI